MPVPPAASIESCISSPVTVSIGELQIGIWSPVRGLNKSTSEREDKEECLGTSSTSFKESVFNGDSVEISAVITKVHPQAGGERGGVPTATSRRLRGNEE